MERAQIAGGLDIESFINCNGFAENEYVEFPATEEASIKWKNVDDLPGGNKAIWVWYSLGKAKALKLVGH